MITLAITHILAAMGGAAFAVVILACVASGRRHDDDEERALAERDEAIRQRANAIGWLP